MLDAFNQEKNAEKSAFSLEYPFFSATFSKISHYQGEKSMLSDCYCVDINAKKPRIESMIKNDFPFEMAEKKTSNIMDLQDHDWRLFKKHSQAEIFLSEYLKIKNALPKMGLLARTDLPKLLLKRKYLITTIMGVKKYTTRHYKKDWKKGQFFQFYDQSFFVTCKLKSITERIINGETFYQYDFKVI